MDLWHRRRIEPRLSGLRGDADHGFAIMGRRRAAGNRFQAGNGPAQVRSDTSRIHRSGETFPPPGRCCGRSPGGCVRRVCATRLKIGTMGTYTPELTGG
ncbi:protein of unassigned function [Methylobacterium oryzae CBMB20]|uniref:Protein of unassigned function n=1 Tax=Methylobacterium oryzae CBMB20 TaxID=693986 RepID=A0A089NQA5_9HYPH|nr:protein of unassigned function [Methylobacterium oryzae CBMB20]